MAAKSTSTRNMTQNADRWYYAGSSNEPCGPLSRRDLDSLAQTGEIQGATLVFREGGIGWAPYASLTPVDIQTATSASIPDSNQKSWMSFGVALGLTLLFCAPIGIIWVALSKRLKITRKVIIGGIGIMWFSITSVPLMVEFYQSADASSRLAVSISQASESSSARNFILRKTSFYADEATLREMETASEKQDDSGTNALKRLSQEGRIWNVDFDIFVEPIKSGGPMDSVYVKAVDQRGLKTEKFWVMKDSLLPVDNQYAKRAMRKGLMRSKKDFAAIFTGNNGIEINEILVSELAEMAEGIYLGNISTQIASRYLFMPEAVEAELSSVAGEYLIYDVVVHPDKHYEVALKRDPLLESEQADIQEFYQGLVHSSFDSSDPIRQGPLVVVGTESFTTQSGLVKMVPVVEIVDLAPW